jgi:hypothetical protein
MVHIAPPLALSLSVDSVPALVLLWAFLLLALMGMVIIMDQVIMDPVAWEAWEVMVKVMDRVAWEVHPRKPKTNISTST